MEGVLLLLLSVLLGHTSTPLSFLRSCVRYIKWCVFWNGLHLLLSYKTHTHTCSHWHALCAHNTSTFANCAFKSTTILYTFCCLSQARCNFFYTDSHPFFLGSFEMRTDPNINLHRYPTVNQTQFPTKKAPFYVMNKISADAHTHATHAHTHTLC